MNKRVCVLGANGRIGRAAVHAFAEAGWAVRAVVRSHSDQRSDIDYVIADATDVQQLKPAIAGCSVIVNAANAPQSQWASMTPQLTEAVLRCTEDSDVDVIIPGNVYVYGESMPGRLKPSTPHKPTTTLGQVRADMEATYKTAASATRRITIVRSGGFFERKPTGNWFENYIVKDVRKGKMVYPGPLDQVYAWAYLPDLARAMVSIVENRGTRDSFEDVGFPGYPLTGQELVSTIESTMGMKMKVATIPWGFLRLMGLFSANMKALVETEYLWRVPHELDDERFTALCPDFRATELTVAMEDVLADHLDQSASPSATTV